MKTILSKLPDEQAKKELKLFTLWAVALSLVSLLVSWILGIVGLALGARALILSYHKGNAKQEKLVLYRAGAVFAIVAGLVSLYFGMNQS